MTPEMSRLVAVDRVPRGGVTEHVVANADERRALAVRFDVLAISELTGLLRLEPWRRGGIKVSGRVDAVVVQTCVVTLDSFEVALTDEIVRYFVGHNAPGPAPVVLSVESLDADAPDVVASGSIDIGEVVAETLGLAIDPYPRKPGAVFGSVGDSLHGADAEAGPFAILDKIKATGRPRKGRA